MLFKIETKSLKRSEKKGGTINQTPGSYRNSKQPNLCINGVLKGRHRNIYTTLYIPNLKK